MHSGLQSIVSRNKIDLLKQKIQFPLSQIQRGLGRAFPVRDFRGALETAKEISLIAELKKASPSAGIIRYSFDVFSGARSYERAGAKALSILTEKNYFLGNLCYMEEAKRATSLPVLRKDFIFDPYQIYESRYYGADAVLLIVALLKDWELSRFVSLIKSLGMTALVEVHSLAELKTALAVGAEVIGVNSRHLKDLSMNPKSFEKIIPKIPKDRTVIAESGIKTAKDVKALKKLKVNGMLVGESLLKEIDIEQAARVLVQAGRGK